MRYLSIAALLLLLFALRAANPERQDPYIDEGFHIERAMRVWDFEQHPARFAHGKVLIYFWLGLFDTGDAGTMLPVSRMSMALIAMLSGAGIYALGRHLNNHKTGLLALFIYTLLPLAHFYEGMAMADPLASMLVILALWRSLILIRFPTASNGVMVGALFALATLAKLTVALVVLLLPAAILLFSDDGWWRKLVRYWQPVLLAGIVFVLVWLPMILPVLWNLWRGDDAFILVNSFNVGSAEGALRNPLQTLLELLPLIGDFLFEGTLLVVLIAALWSWRNRAVRLLLLWFVALTLLPLLLAHLITARYYMPIAAPLALIVSLLILQGHNGIRQALTVALIAWGMLWAIPFIYTDVTAPHQLPFSGTNRTEYIEGWLIGDDAVRAAAADLNALNPDHAVATWSICHMALFYVDVNFECLPQGQVGSGLRAAVSALPDGQSLYLLVSGFQPFWENDDDLVSETVAVHERRLINRPVFIIRLQPAP